MTQPIGAIGTEDKHSGNVSYATQVKKKNPWENIGALMNGFGSYVNNLPDNFNSAFTVGKQGGTEEVGAFKA